MKGHTATVNAVVITSDGCKQSQVLLTQLSKFGTLTQPAGKLHYFLTCTEHGCYVVFISSLAPVESWFSR